MHGAKIKCSNCGAEITNLTLGWGKRAWLSSLLFFIPMIAFLMWTEHRLRSHNHLFVDEIQTSIIDTNSTATQFDLHGKLKNIGEHIWERIQVEAEFYGDDGTFLDETSAYLSVSLPPQGEENFKLTLHAPDPKISEKSKIILKVADANEARF